MGDIQMVSEIYSLATFHASHAPSNYPYDFHLPFIELVLVVVSVSQAKTTSPIPGQS